MASEYPAHIAMILGDDENVWAQPPVTAADIKAGRVQTFDLRVNMGLPEWQVYSSAGSLRAIVSVPQGFHLRRIVGDRLFGTATNTNDEPVVQVLRVTLPR